MSGSRNCAVERRGSLYAILILSAVIFAPIGFMTAEVFRTRDNAKIVFEVGRTVDSVDFDYIELITLNGDKNLLFKSLDETTDNSTALYSRSIFFDFRQRLSEINIITDTATIGILITDGKTDLDLRSKTLGQLTTNGKRTLKITITNFVISPVDIDIEAVLI
jgi:hypothetical protein